MLEADGGVYGCDLPCGHSGPHSNESSAHVRPKRSRSYTDVAGAAAALASARDFSGATAAPPPVTTKPISRKQRLHHGLGSNLRISDLASSGTLSASSPSLTSSAGASPAPSVSGSARATGDSCRVSAASRQSSACSSSSRLGSSSCSRGGGVEGERRSMRATKGAVPSRLGADDGWGRGPAGAWASSSPGGAEALAEFEKKRQREQDLKEQDAPRQIMRPVAAAGLALQQRMQQQQKEGQARREADREARRLEEKRLAKIDPAAAARLREINDVECESDRLQSMTYDELYAEKREWIESAPVSVREEFPTRSTWGKDWSRKIEKALSGRLVRKRYLMGGLAHATNFGRVVGCEAHWFEVLYEDGYYESMSWHDLSRVLVPHATRDVELVRLEQEETEGLVRSSRRAPKKRDLAAEVEQYLPRQGCHLSLPVGKVACHLHEELRLSGLVVNDPGPEVSD